MNVLSRYSPTLIFMLMKKLYSGLGLGRWGVKLLLALVMVLSGLTLTSCYVDSSWSPAPPYGWNDTFYDQRLNGYWELVEVNGRGVGGYDVDFLYFNGYGRGTYFYYYNGRRMWETTAYWCQDAVSGSSYYQINLQYETSGSPTTMNYWFGDRGYTLFMQWRTSYGVQTYVYRAINGAPW